MKAAVVTERGKLSVMRVPVPKFLDNEILVEVKAAAICNRTDVEIIDGRHPPFSYPVILGHEASGKVHKIGKRVKDFSVGDRVAIAPWPGAFAEYCKVDSRSVCRIPDEMSFEEAAIIEMLTCAFFLTWKCIKLGDSVAILGMGSAGLLNLQCARAMGADKIIVSDLFENKRALAKELGADVVVDPRNESLEKVVKEETQGEGVDVVIDAVSVPETFKQALDIIKSGGTFGLFGVCLSPVEITPAIFHFKCIRLIPSGPEDPYPIVFRRAVRLVETGKVNLKRLISHRYPLTKITEAFKLVREHPEEVVKVIVYPK